jgi:glycosyltransferase involved in cell wall biosynthesis
MKIRALYPSFATDRAVSHISLSVCHAMRCAETDVRLMKVSSTAEGRRAFNRDAIPSWLFGVSCLFFRTEARLRRFVERRYLRWLQAGDVAYLWPMVSMETYHEVRRRGHTLVVERINCHRGTAKRILDDAYARLGWKPNHGVKDEDVEGEKRKLEMADYVFSPSPRVDESLVENGVPRQKIFSTSFGWSPQRINGATKRALPEMQGLTVVFVGLAGVRKGVPWLLRAWERAGIRGQLLLAGRIEPDVAEHCASALNRKDVISLGFVSDIAAVYRGADVFVFPSLEEGGPLVTYEAMGSGLPVVVTPMGAGAVAADGAGGAVIVPPRDEEALIVALRRLEKDAELRRDLGEQGRLRAEEFTWERVGRRRSRQLVEAIGQTSPAPRPETPVAAVPKSA